MIGIVIPLYRGEGQLESCLEAVHAAARHPSLNGEMVHVAIVLNKSKASLQPAADARARHAEPNFHLSSISINTDNVALARAAGTAYLLELGARALAFIDVDAELPAPDWLK
jgi:hypothetical protein